MRLQCCCIWISPMFNIVQHIQNNFFIFRCPLNFSVDFCNPNPCLNDGQCSLDDKGDVLCTRLSGYLWARCDFSKYIGHGDGS